MSTWTAEPVRVEGLAEPRSADDADDHARSSHVVESGHMKTLFEVIDPFFCDVNLSHLEGDDLVCQKHGFMWALPRPYCNAISDETIALIEYAANAQNTLAVIARAAQRYTHVT